MCIRDSFDTVLEDSARRFLDYLSGTTLDTVFLKLDKRECPSPHPEPPKGQEQLSACPWPSLGKAPGEREADRGLAEQNGGEAYDAV